MAAAVARPIRQSSGEPPLPSAPSEGHTAQAQATSPREGSSPPIGPSDTYRFAIEEYRFQAQFNWTRTQYLLAFNAAVLAVASGLYDKAGSISILVFALGFIAAVSCLFVVATQHGYYRAARDRLRRIEDALRIEPELKFDTTQGLGGKARTRFRPSVNGVIQFLLIAIAVADVVGVVFAALA